MKNKNVVDGELRHTLNGVDIDIYSAIVRMTKRTLTLGLGLG